MNGFQSYFKVYPVQMVAAMPKLKRENGRSGQRRPDSSKSSAFNILLDNALKETCPADCYTVTYTADRQLKTYSYHVSKEYTF